MKESMMTSKTATRRDDAHRRELLAATSRAQARRGRRRHLLL